MRVCSVRVIFSENLNFEKKKKILELDLINFIVLILIILVKKFQY